MWNRINVIIYIMKIYFGIVAVILATLANAECTNGSCGKVVTETVSADSVVVPPIHVAKKGKKPYTLDNCPYCNKRGCRWC